MFPIGDTNEPGRWPLVNYALIILNILIFLFEITATDTDAFISRYALTPALIHWNDWHTLIPFMTSQFLHGGWLHIGGNMLFLWVFGDNVEKRMGVFYLPFYLVAGVVGNLLQYVIDPSSTIPGLGASGAIAGVLGAYLVMFPRNLIKTLVIFFGFITITEIPAPIMLVYWFITQLFNGVLSVAAVAQGGVAYFAHIGGFATGLAAAWLFFKNRAGLQYLGRSSE